MARDPGEWYEERAAEAERLAQELAGARKVLDALAAVEGATASESRIRMYEAAGDVVRRLERQLEQARYVGD
jgi:hypothetical protein